MMKVTPAFKFERAPDWWELSTEPCVMHKGDGSCTGLSIMCPGTSHCSFFKDKKEAEASQREWRRRLNSLSDSTQEYIAEKYYGRRKL